MLITGEWHLCDDEIVRPIIRGEVRTFGGLWAAAPFLVDTAAVRTVLSADIVEALELPENSPEIQLGGVGGVVGSLVLDTSIAFRRDDGKSVMIHGKYAGIPDSEALDISVLGRDILNLFAVIVDKPQDRVCLLGHKHGYVIEPN